ncbi:M67 family metallopeptidase [Pannus brasiliensis CCIBt3594]|uniref:M67 family metallopeptidase n=1 Tax=Pannus brasiliensis CCIBt3594 TaxID=1427578 RepID=A0AAW9QUF9_9CHRO
MILIPPNLDNCICTWLESLYPEEGCGLLLGELTETGARAIEAWPAENTWTGDKKTRFEIAPEAMFRAQKTARERGLEIIGVYHSHPDHPAIPSSTDRELAWPGYSYVIVSIGNGKAIEARSWRLDENERFQEEAIERA